MSDGRFKPGSVPWNKGKPTGIEPANKGTHLTHDEKVEKLGHRKNYHIWTDDEDEFVREHYEERGGVWIAERLGTSTPAVYHRAKSLGVKRDNSLKTKQVFARPGYKDAWLETQRTPEQRRIRSESASAQVADPSMMKAWRDGFRSFIDSDRGQDHREACRQSLLNQSPEDRAKAQAASAESWTPERRVEQSERKVELWKDNAFRERWLSSYTGKPSCGTCKGGRRPDLDHYVRSTWEANYARILNLEGIRYTYEPERFLLDDDGVTRGYTPDFYLHDADMYVEVKGFNPAFGDADLRRFTLFRLQYPDKQIVLVDPAHYKQLTLRYADRIDMWETQYRNIKTHPHLFTGDQQALQLNGRG